MNRKTKSHWRSPMAATVLLIFLIALISVLSTSRINSMEEARSFTRLGQEADSLIGDIQAEMYNDREELEVLAEVISGYEDMTSPELWEVIESYDTIGAFSRVDLLLPDDTVLTEGGQEISSGGKLSFEEEASLGAHISGRETDMVSEEKYIVRNCVPVVRGEETVAMLCGIVELDNLPVYLRAAPYGGAAAFYIIDASTGDILTDTWSGQLNGNISQFDEREFAPGYDHNQLREGIIRGDSGYVVFMSEMFDEHLYLYYEPVGINGWRLLLSVPESAVFENVDSIRYILNLFLVFQAVCFVVYFFWMLYYVRRETRAKQRQLDMIQYIYDVEKLLFNAHESRENIAGALEKIAQITMAQCVFFWICDDSVVKECFRWCTKNHELFQDSESGLQLFEELLRHFSSGENEFAAYDASEVERELPGLVPSDEAVSFPELIAVSVSDMSGNICGVLACVGLQDRDVTPDLLSNVSFSFRMFCHNLKVYDTIREQGERDILSGLYNRNRYEMDLPLYHERVQTSLACVYIDVNGLHERNNTEGHEAGDRMLRCVADHIRQMFGDECSYRIGGDEFLVFEVDQDRESVFEKGRQLEDILEKKGIHISVGTQWEEREVPIDELIKAAEKKMYEAKRRFYQQKANERSKRGRSNFNL